MTIASLQHFIAGQHAAGVSTRTQPVYNPATGAVTANVSLASSADVNVAVAAALNHRFVVEEQAALADNGIAALDFTSEAASPDETRPRSSSGAKKPKRRPAKG